MRPQLTLTEAQLCTYCFHGLRWAAAEVGHVMAAAADGFFVKTSPVERKGDTRVATCREKSAHRGPPGVGSRAQAIQQRGDFLRNTRYLARI